MMGLLYESHQSHLRRVHFRIPSLEHSAHHCGWICSRLCWSAASSARRTTSETLHPNCLDKRFAFVYCAVVKLMSVRLMHPTYDVMPKRQREIPFDYNCLRCQRRFQIMDVSTLCCG